MQRSRSTPLQPAKTLRAAKLFWSSYAECLSQHSASSIRSNDALYADAWASGVLERLAAPALAGDVASERRYWSLLEPDDVFRWGGIDMPSLHSSIRSMLTVPEAYRAGILPLELDNPEIIPVIWESVSASVLAQVSRELELAGVNVLRTVRDISMSTSGKVAYEPMLEAKLQSDGSRMILRLHCYFEAKPNQIPEFPSILTAFPEWRPAQAAVDIVYGRTAGRMLRGVSQIRANPTAPHDASSFERAAPVLLGPQGMACAHPKAEWAANEFLKSQYRCPHCTPQSVDACDQCRGSGTIHAYRVNDALVLGCPDCGRRRLARVPVWQLPQHWKKLDSHTRNEILKAARMDMVLAGRSADWARRQDVDSLRAMAGASWQVDLSEVREQVLEQASLLPVSPAPRRTRRIRL